MEIEVWRMALIMLLTFAAIYDTQNLKLELRKPVIAGMFAGLIMGDIQTGLMIGATLQLMILGVSHFGGSSIPDYLMATIIATVLAVSSGQGLEFGLGLAIPVALLMIQLDIFIRFINIFFMHRAERYAEEERYDMVSAMNVLGLGTWFLLRGAPVFLALYFGTAITSSILEVMPAWLTAGLKVTGGLLPCLGIAMLLKYLPIKQNFAYLMVGFFLAAYLKTPILGIAIVGFAAAFISYQNNVKQQQQQPVAGSGGIDDDE